MNKNVKSLLTSAYLDTNVLIGSLDRVQLLLLNIMKPFGDAEGSTGDLFLILSLHYEQFLKGVKYLSRGQSILKNLFEPKKTILNIPLTNKSKLVWDDSNLQIISRLFARAENYLNKSTVGLVRVSDTFQPPIVSLIMVSSELAEIHNSITHIQTLLSQAELISLQSKLNLPPQDWRFISNEHHKVILARDYLELDALINAKAHKSTIVLSGSILEAILTSILAGQTEKAESIFRQQYPKQKNVSIDRWKLFQLIEVAIILGILDDFSGRQAHIIRDYRNYIHPDVEVRRNSSLDENLAKSIVALLKHILKILSQGD